MDGDEVVALFTFWVVTIVMACMFSWEYGWSQAIRSVAKKGRPALNQLEVEELKLKHKAAGEC